MDWGELIHQYGIYAVILWMATRDIISILRRAAPHWFKHLDRQTTSDISIRENEQKFQHELQSQMVTAIRGLDATMNKQTELLTNLAEGQAKLVGKQDALTNAFYDYSRQGYKAMQNIAVLADRKERSKKKIKLVK